MKRRDEVLVGLMTLGTIVLLVGGMLWLARGGLSHGYPLYARFEWGAGLKQGQPVLFSGANIGYVDDVHILDGGGIVVVMRIYKHQHVPEGSVATIEPYGIFGDQLIALKTKLGPTGRFIAAGDTLPSGPPAIQLGDVIARVDSIARSVNGLVGTLNTTLTSENPVRSVRLAAQSADSMFRMVSRMVTEQSKQLTKTQEDLMHAVSSIDSARIAPAVQSLQSAVTNATKLMNQFQETGSRLDHILAKVDSGDGSAARLLNSGKLEEDTRATITRLNALIDDFMKNPRKYIKLSIF